MSVIDDLNLTLVVASRAYAEALFKATQAMLGFAKLVRKHPRPGHMPRKRQHRKPPPWHRARRR